MKWTIRWLFSLGAAAAALLTSACGEELSELDQRTLSQPLFEERSTAATAVEEQATRQTRTAASSEMLVERWDVLADRLEPIPIDNMSRAERPLVEEDAERLGLEFIQSARFPDVDEESSSLPTGGVRRMADDLILMPAAEDSAEVEQARVAALVERREELMGQIEEILVAPAEWGAIVEEVTGQENTGQALEIVEIDPWLFGDDDGDCSPNLTELIEGTSPWNPDTDGDGWYDGPCNQRRRLFLERITAHDEQEDIGEDETYLIVDDVRFPDRERDLDDWWDFDDGDVLQENRLVAERVRGTNRYSALLAATVEGWEDDWEPWNTWTVDDLLFQFTVDMGAWADGQTITVRRSYDDWDYEIRLRMRIQYFADPNPLSAQADRDRDGIPDSAEFAVARDFGGITDPQRRDVLVEVDWMAGHGLNTESKRMVTTQYHRYGYDLVVLRHQVLPFDPCLTATEARNLYKTYFTFKNYDAFRYAVLSEELWNDASGVALGDTFFTDDSTWWIDGGVLAQAGTFMHELGHTMGLLQSSTYYQIDTIGDATYDSVMNYLYQALMVDYSYDDTSGFWGGDHNDWADVDPSYGLNFSFGNTTWTANGICGG